jgi:tRNA G18 (ribose-2'-O)-methylase SpoU
MKTTVTLVLDNLRSTYNVGSLLRSADGFGVTSVITTGITPHMKQQQEDRLPHVVTKATKQISKTALGGEHLLAEHFISTIDAIQYLRKNNYHIVSLEQHPSKSIPLPNFSDMSKPIALVLGNEIDGVSDLFLEASTYIIEIPMMGIKESFNVAVSGSIALYHLSNQI